MAQADFTRTECLVFSVLWQISGITAGPEAVWLSWLKSSCLFWLWRAMGCLAFAGITGSQVEECLSSCRLFYWGNRCIYWVWQCELFSSTDSGTEAWQKLMMFSSLMWLHQSWHHSENPPTPVVGRLELWTELWYLLATEQISVSTVSAKRAKGLCPEMEACSRCELEA